ncbi:MAG: 30S ribosomal protein S5 [bacterium]
MTEDKKFETKNKFGSRRPDMGSRKRFVKKKIDNLDRKIVSIRRVTRVYKGGKRMRLSVLLVVGDKKGRVGVGLAKGADVKAAEEKAFNKARKNIIIVPLKGTTIPHEILFKKGAAKIFLKPAAPGTGVIAGGSLRAVLELAGVQDILTKVIGSSNPISNVYATFEALQNLISRRTSNVKQTIQSNN